MVFQSVTYFWFLVIVLSGYFALQWPVRTGRRWARTSQNLWLLAASYTFYGWVTPWWLALISTTTLVDFTAARLIAATDDPHRRRLCLTASLIVNFSILCAFKYFGFFAENVTTALEAAGLNAGGLTTHAVGRFLIQVGLPVGISFFTFQSASYVIDVYRGRTDCRHSLIDYALFVSFFPQLVAGPIERSENLLRQVDIPRRPTLAGWRSGLVLLFWGLLQKVVIADSAAVLTNKVFALDDPSFPILWAGVLCFGVQIYADFSAYTDIARGSARLLGFELLRNFNHPYLAQSPGEFWHRWHMTLSTWFRDYVFIPLGGSRRGIATTVRNVLITFFLSGLWHGASWNFVLWGVFHGVLVAAWPRLSRLVPWLERGGGPLGVGIRVALTFLLVHFGWLLFREHQLANIGRALQLNPFDATTSHWRMGFGLVVETWIYAFPLLILLPALQWLRLIPAVDDPRLLTWRWSLAQGVALAGCLLGILLLRSEVGSDFIYFAF
ncbi:MAG: MBOAT family O-acyltransferase [Verrucomicrobiales bacterium]